MFWQVVDVELERDSIGLGTPLQTARSGNVPQGQTLSMAVIKTENHCDGENMPTVDLSIVKTECPDTQEVGHSIQQSRTSEEHLNRTIKEEPTSPVRSRASTPGNMVLGGPGSTGVLGTLVPIATTPEKDGSRWTHHVQIKSEPTSPQQSSPGPNKGWKNIVNLSSPLKQEPDAMTCSPQRSKVSGVSLLSRTPPDVSLSQRSSGHAQTPPQIILTPGGSIIQQHNISQGHGKGNQISLMTGQSALSNLQVTPKGQSGMTASPSGASAVMQGGQPQTLLLGPSPSQPKVPALSSPTAARNQQSAVYIRCLDNQGKVYLIPQQLLNKSSPGTTGTVTPVSTPRPMQKVSTPMGMTLVPASGKATTSTCLPSPTAVGMTTLSGVRPVLIGQDLTSPSVVEGASGTSAKSSSLTTTIKTGVGTATLTYILASTTPTTSTHSTTPRLSTSSARVQPSIQKLAMALQPRAVSLPLLTGQGQSLILASPPEHGQGQRLILSSPPSQSQGQSLILTTQASQSQGQSLILTSQASQSPGQSLILASQPGKGQSLILSSLPSSGQAQSLSLSSAPEDIVSGKSSQPGTPVASRPGTPATLVSPHPEPQVKVAQSLTESVRIIGGSIVATGSNKLAGVMLVSGPPNCQTRTVDPPVRAAATSQTAGVSLLSGVAGHKPTSATPKSLSGQTLLSSATPVISLLAKPAPGVNQGNQVKKNLPAATLILNPEPRLFGGNLRSAVKATESGSKSAPFLLIRNPASTPVRPRGQALMAGASTTVPQVHPAKSSPIAMPQSILKTIGNQTVLVQLLPNQEGLNESTNQETHLVSDGLSGSSSIQSHLVIKPDKPGTGTYFIHAEGQTEVKDTTKEDKPNKEKEGQKKLW